jgi:hypothetical protein
MWDLNYPGVRVRNNPISNTWKMDNWEYQALDTQGGILPRHLSQTSDLQKIIEKLICYAMNYDK